MFPGNQSLPLGLGFPPPPPPPPPVLPGTTTSAVRNAPQSSVISHAFQKLGTERAGRSVQGSSGGVSGDHGLRKQSSSSDERGTEEDMRPVSRDCYSTGLGGLRMSRHSYVSSLPSPLGSGNTSHQTEASPSPIRGFQPYRAGEESTLPAFPLPAFPIVDPRFDSFHGSLDVSNAFSLSSYRFDDSLVLDCYPQFPFPHAGLLPSPGIHPLLSPLLRYPADFLAQQYMSSYLSNVSQMASSTSDGRLLSEELRRLSTGKDKDREKDKEQERQQDRKKEKEQDWLRERQEWEKQEAKMKMNGISSNGLGPVQGQGQALSLVTQLGELTAAVSRVESQRCSGLREAMYSSSLISSQAFAPKPETMEAFKNLLPKVPDERLKSFIHGSRELTKKEDNDNAAMNGQRNWFTRMTSTSSPGSVAQDSQETTSSDPNAKRRIQATFHRPFEVAPVNGCGKELSRLKIQKDKSDKTTVVAAPGLNSYKSLNMLGNVVPVDHKLSAAPVIFAKSQTPFTMESGPQHNSKKTKDRSDGSRLEVKRPDDRSVEQIQRSQFESFLENLNSKGQKSQQKRRQMTELPKTAKTPDAGICTRKDKAIESLALDRMKHLTRDTSLQPLSKKPCLPHKTVPEMCLRSRLDDRERKLVEARKNGTYVSDDVSDNENILLDDVAHQKLLLITSGPPLKMMRSKWKTDFLKEFGLMTQREGKEFKFHQERKRRRLHFQRNLSPTELENAPPDNVSTLPAKPSTCEDLNMHDDFKQKAYFLHKMGLMSTMLEHRKKAKLARHGCLAERKKNGDAAGLTTKLTPLNHFANGGNTTSELPKREDNSRVLSCRWPSAQETTSPSVGCRLVPLSKSSSSHQIKSSKLSVNSQKTHSNLEPGIGENGKTSTLKLKDTASFSTGHLVIRTPDMFNGRDLVEDNTRGSGQQLVASTKGQMSNWQQHRNSQDSLTTKSQRCDGDKAMPVAAAMITKWTGTLPASSSEETKNRQQHTNGQHNESLDWPGISLLIDAYHRYDGEQRLECRILREQCSRTQTKNHELQFKRDSLAKHISDLKQTKEALETERNMIQNTVDCLKKCLKWSLLW